MRQRRATWAIVGVSVVIVGVLIAFGCERSTAHHEGHMEESGHMMGGEHHHEEGAEEHMEEPAHHEEVEGHHEEKAEEEHTGEAHKHEAEAEEPGELEPSGKIVDGVRVVQVKAMQFEFQPSTIVVRRGERVRLEVTSQDVAHGMGIEAYDINRTLPPKETQEIEFTADRPGRHHFHCTVYCGTGHNDMHGELVVLEEVQ